MGLKDHALELHEDKSDQAWTLSLHTYSNLTYTSPVVFLFLLKECYAAGILLHFANTCTIAYSFSSCASLSMGKLQN